MPISAPAYDRYGHAAFAQGHAGRGRRVPRPVRYLPRVFGGGGGGGMGGVSSRRSSEAGAAQVDREGRSAVRFALRHADHAGGSAFGWRKRSKFESSTPARNATAKARVAVRARLIARPAVAAVRSSAHADFPGSQTVHVVEARARHRETVPVCEGEGRVFEKTSRIKSRSRGESGGIRCAPRAMEKQEFAAAGQGIFTWSFM